MVRDEKLEGSMSGTIPSNGVEATLVDHHNESASSKANSRKSAHTRSKSDRAKSVGTKKLPEGPQARSFPRFPFRKL
jgi:hypothetical protein